MKLDIYIYSRIHFHLFDIMFYILYYFVHQCFHNLAIIVSISYPSNYFVLYIMVLTYNTLIDFQN